MHSQNKIIIVGAGLAGLTAAAYLSKAGKNVLLIDKNSVPGGLLTSFEREGFTFDSGARSIENSGVIRPMIRELGIDMDLLESPVSLGIADTIIDFTSKDSMKQYQNLLIKLFPNEEKGINRIFKVIKRIMRSMHGIYGFDNPIFRDFKKDKKYLFLELIPQMRNFLPAVWRMGRMTEPIEDYLTKFTNDSSLIDIICQHFFYHTNVFFALGYYYVYGDYIYPRGGTGQLTQKLAEKIIEFGGSISYETFIENIDANKKLITDKNGKSYSYDQLIWCGDTKFLYKHLDTGTLDSNTKNKVSKISKKLLSKRGGDSVFSLYLATDLPIDYFAKKNHGHFFYTPSSQGLGAARYDNVQDLIKNFDSIKKENVLTWLKTSCERDTYEISIPAYRDPALAPKGQSGVIINFFMEYELIKKIKKAGWLKEFISATEDNIIQVLNASIYPGLKEKILFKFSATPLTIEHIGGSSEGAITGWSYIEKVPVENKIFGMPRAIKTPIKDIYQAGQWTYTPAGIPIAIMTGWYAADEILSKQ